MSVQITGKNLDIGDALRFYIEDRIGQTLDKFMNNATSGHVRIEKDGNQFRTDCSLHLDSGLDLQSKGESHDVYASADAALERLETRLRRYKRRLKNHHNKHSTNGFEAATPALDYVIQPQTDDEENGEDDTPIIIAESETKINECAVSDAVMQMDLAESSVVVFRNASHGRINIVYRRDDGNIGWIDPS
jgi:ribosomal subunit interface protein